MEMFFAIVFGALIGTAAIVLVRSKDKLGLPLLPALGALTAALSWAVMSWLSIVPGFEWLRYDRGWIWALLVLLCLAVTVTVAITVPRRRAADDKDLLDRLTHVGHAR